MVPAYGYKLPTGYISTQGFLGEIPYIASKRTLDRLAEWIIGIIDTPVKTTMIKGRTGTGKELVATAINYLRPNRKNCELKRFPCGSIAPPVIESALFGHVEGSFTGANRDRIGFLGKLKDGDIAFIDQSEDLPIDCQTRLLDVLAEGRFSPVGAEEDFVELPEGIHFILGAGSNEDVSSMVASGKYREDLLARCWHPFSLSPLDSATDELPLLVEHYAPLALANELKKRLNADRVSEKVKRLAYQPERKRSVELSALQLSASGSAGFGLCGACQ